jgi:hypothetical protein
VVEPPSKFFRALQGPSYHSRNRLAHDTLKVNDVVDPYWWITPLPGIAIEYTSGRKPPSMMTYSSNTIPDTYSRVRQHPVRPLPSVKYFSLIPNTYLRYQCLLIRASGKTIQAPSQRSEYSSGALTSTTGTAICDLVRCYRTYRAPPLLRVSLQLPLSQ